VNVLQNSSLVLSSVNTPQLTKLHAGKVRDSFKLSATERLLVVTDRISAFDLKLQSSIPQKGAVLNHLAAYWFVRTADIVPNHLVRVLADQASIVREAIPIRVEMIVRGYMAGSMARGYAASKRVFSGVTVEDGLSENAKLAQPILTPTTKEDNDRELAPEQLVREGFCTMDRYNEMAKVALALFARGAQLLAEKGLLLADTKYEFGLVDDQLVLIDEIHTPDSSRIWDAAQYAKGPAQVQPLDKEFVRAYMLKIRKETGSYPLTLPVDVIDETRRRYVELLRRVTGTELRAAPDAAANLYDALVAGGYIKSGFVAICMGSPSDMPHAERVRAVLDIYGVKSYLRIVSAHKNGERIGELAALYGDALEPGAIVAIAGESNGLGGALAANIGLPLINSPPYRDRDDLMVNIHSSLMMPSNTPATTVVKPENAALAALRALNLRSLKQRFAEEIGVMKHKLREADDALMSAQ
jgi:fusion protein PurCD